MAVFWSCFSKDTCPWAVLGTIVLLAVHGACIGLWTCLDKKNKKMYDNEESLNKDDTGTQSWWLIQEDYAERHRVKIMGLVTSTIFPCVVFDLKSDFYVMGGTTSLLGFLSLIGVLTATDLKDEETARHSLICLFALLAAYPVP